MGLTGRLIMSRVIMTRLPSPTASRGGTPPPSGHRSLGTAMGVMEWRNKQEHGAVILWSDGVVAGEQAGGVVCPGIQVVMKSHDQPPNATVRRLERGYGGQPRL